MTISQKKIAMQWQFLKRKLLCKNVVKGLTNRELKNLSL